MKKSVIIPAVMIALATFSTTARAEVADVIPVGGVLTDLTGTPIDGNTDIAFALYDDEFSTSPIWSEAMTGLPLDNGVFAVYLGDTVSNPIDFYTIVSSSELWLGITVETDSEMDLIQLGSVPFAIEAEYCRYIGDMEEADIQPVLSGTNACPAGSYLRGWDDTLEQPICEADGVGFEGLSRSNSPTDTVISVLDSTGSVGYYPSITIGTDGFGIISYKDNTTGALKVAHCDDTACTTATITTVAAGGERSEIAIGADGLPVIAFDYAGSIAVTHCTDVACTGSSEVTVQVGDSTYPAITIGADGLPLVGYKWGGGSSGGLRVAHCSDAACTTSTVSDARADCYLNGWVEVGIGGDGLGVFAYKTWMSGNTTIAVTHCDDITCSAATSNVVSSIQDVRAPNMTIGPDGLPIIVFNYFWGGPIHTAHCNDATCSGNTDVVYSIGNMQPTQGTYSITIGADDLPLITYSNYASDDVLRSIHCSSAVCAEAGHGVIAGSGAGAETSVTIGEDGNPLIAYRNEVDGDLMVAHCSNPLCVPYFKRR